MSFYSKNMGKYRKLLIVAGCFMLAFVACKKDKVEPVIDIIGSWVQVTDSQSKIFLRFNELNDMELRYSNGMIINFKYQFSKPDELELFLAFQFPKGTSTKHHIEYSEETKELRIYDLIRSDQEIPEAIVFIRQ